MLLLFVFAVIVATVPLARGSLLRLTELPLRRSWALFAALALQVAVIKVWPDADHTLIVSVHLASYVVAAVFVMANRATPGMLLVGLGWLGNAAAIAANGGTMPASPQALQAAGMALTTEEFRNSTAVAAPRLQFLGDVFALPAPLPLANVFSIGDVLLLIGVGILLHNACGSRLLPTGTHQFSALRPHKGFMRLWSAQAISNLGDWSYSLAVAATVADRADAAHLLATLLIMQVGPAAVTGLLGGPLLDRVHRTKLMVLADAARAVAVGSLLLASTPSLPHLYAVAATLGTFSALFQPAMYSSLPNLVPRSRLVAANALVAGTYHAAIMIGPVIGGLLVVHLGARPAYALNAISFIVSAMLVAGVPLPLRGLGGSTLASARDEFVEGMRYAARNHTVRGILLTLGVTVFAAAIRAPLEPLFVLQTLGREASALGLTGGAWGFGMVLGALAAPAAARRWSRERLLWISIALVGLSVLMASRATILSPVLGFWLVAGSGNAVGTIAYETLLQERTSDALRGRVMAASEAVVQIAYLLGVVVAGLIGGPLGLRGSYAVSGVLFLVAAATSKVVLRPAGARRRRSAPGWTAAPVPAAMPVGATGMVGPRALVVSAAE